VILLVQTRVNLWDQPVPDRRFRFGSTESQARFKSASGCPETASYSGPVMTRNAESFVPVIFPFDRSCIRPRPHPPGAWPCCLSSASRRWRCAMFSGNLTVAAARNRPPSRSDGPATHAGRLKSLPGGKLKMMKALPPGAHSQSCSQRDGKYSQSCSQRDGKWNDITLA
jgi:hypothetical protein